MTEAETKGLLPERFEMEMITELGRRDMAVLFNTVPYLLAPS